MDDIAGLLHEYLLVAKSVEESEKELAREELKTTFESLQNLMLDEDIWKLFLDEQYDIADIKSRLNVKDDQERCQIFKVGLSPPHEALCDKTRLTLQFGMSCLITFTQANFTGPHPCEKVVNFLKQDMFKKQDFHKMLSYNNEEINCKTEFPQLLATAKIIFEWCIVNSIINIWWYWRALYLHQQILDELSPSLLSDADRLYKLLMSNFKIKALDIEIAQLYLLFRLVGKANGHIESAKKLMDLNYEYVGILGKRTRHQEKEIPQLALKNVNENLVLSNISQKLMLTIVQQMLISKPADELQHEEILPFVESILAQKNTFCVRVVSLLLRCRAESKNRRTVERALRQCEEVLSAFRKDQPEAFDRFHDVFGSGLPAMWKVTIEYADLLLNIGLPKNALDLYLKLQLWEEVIVCYTLMNQRHKAAEVIAQQLEKKPTVKLLCLLGDATDDITCYEKAWELSKRRSHRAQRHWGNHLYAKKNYADCIPHFEKSVSINPLQANVWFRLGFAAHQTENWQVAATAYKRYTTLEPDGFEAWNNLAQAYLKIGNKRSAHQALSEALKCNYENWKVWENFLIVSSDISMYFDVIRAYHRMLDLKEKYINIHVLGELVCDVVDNSIDCEGLPAARFLQKTRELLGRVVSIHPGEGIMWDLYAKVAPTAALKAQRFQRAFKAYTRNVDWHKDPKQCNQVLYVCFELSEIALMPEIDASNTLLNSTKMILTCVFSALQSQAYAENKEAVDRLAITFDVLIRKMTNKDASK
ncbi:hypothetical protein YQE_09814, partial [Dendroctonus ponderosae]